jgi:cytochrome b
MNEPTASVRVWDLPTRIFHWSLAVCVISSLLSAWRGGNAMVWHFWLGYASIALLGFRIVWGIVGGRWSRFTSFVFGPATLWRYLRGASAADELHEVGHSPLGALSVFALLALLMAQVATGLFADDEISNTGPLNKFVAEATGHSMTRWHKGFGQWLIVALIVLHVLAIGYYLVVRKRNLVRPMWSGDKALAAPTPASIDNARSRVIALGVFAVCAGLVAVAVNLVG